MYLIKDLIDCRIVFYWLDERGYQISPDLCSFPRAEEWWKAHMFAQYKGVERRTSIVDRRTDFDKRQRMDNSYRFASINPYGRRQTDQPIKVHLDLADEKLMQLAAKERVLCYLTNYTTAQESDRHS